MPLPRHTMQLGWKSEAVPGPRDYSVGTERALYDLARGTCYEPTCDEPTIRFVGGRPVSNVHIAHIYGAFPNSPRYVESMSDKERASFDNLILLCKPHHDLVDRIAPDDYAPELLKQWKAAREGDGVAALRELRGLTEDSLAEMLEDAVRSIGPTREVVLDVSGGLILGGEAISVPLRGWRTVLEQNPNLRGERVLIATARNTSQVAATVDSFTLYCSIRTPNTSGEELPALTLLGRNDFPELNPKPGARLDVGASMNWFTRLATVATIIAPLGTDRFHPVDIYIDAKLGSGETVLSERHPIGELPFEQG